MVDRNLGRCIDNQSARDQVRQKGGTVHTVVVGSVGNGVGTGAREATIVVNRTGPITTDGGVDDN